MSYDSEVLSDSPYVYYKMGEATGAATATDSSGNARNGTYKQCSAAGAWSNNTADGANIRRGKLPYSGAGLIATAPTETCVLFTNVAADTVSTTTFVQSTNIAVYGGLGALELAAASAPNLTGSYSVETWILIPSGYAPTTVGINNHAGPYSHGQQMFTFMKGFVTGAGQCAVTIGSSGAITGIHYGTRPNATLTGVYRPYTASSLIKPTYIPYSTNGVDFSPCYQPPYGETLMDGKPHHIVFTADTTNKVIKMYVDGVLMQYQYPTGLTTNESNTADPLIFANRYSATANSCYGYVGYMSHVAVYTSVLSAERIAAHYYAASGAYGALDLAWSSTGGKPNTAAETSSFGDSVLPNATSNVASSDTSNFTDTAEGKINPTFTITETIGINEDMTSFAAMVASLSNGVGMDDTVEGLRGLNAVVIDNVNNTAGLSIQQILQGRLTDGMLLVLGGNAAEGFTVGWVVNAETAAASMYANYKFESFAKRGNKYFGCNSEGIFELTGDNDDGDGIDASILTAKMDFGTTQLKSMANAILGVAQTGDIFLRVVHENSPSYTYRLTSSSEAMRNERFTIGKGIALRYWQFELYNDQDADFSLESMTLYPVVLSRRITER